MDTTLDIEQNRTEKGVASGTVDKVNIIYGTHTGNTMMLADEVEESVSELGFETEVADMEDFDADSLPQTQLLLVLLSTDGEGDQPLMSEDLYAYLCSEDAPDLSHLQFSVLALGDMTYDNFCQAGKDFDAALEKLGGNRIAKRIDCDVDYEDQYEVWIDLVLNALKAIKSN